MDFENLFEIQGKSKVVSGGGKIYRIKSTIIKKLQSRPLEWRSVHQRFLKDHLPKKNLGM